MYQNYLSETGINWISKPLFNLYVEHFQLPIFDISVNGTETHCVIALDVINIIHA